MYVQVVPPAPAPPSFACRTFQLGCPTAPLANPDALASVLAGSAASAFEEPSGMGDFVRMPRARMLALYRPPLRRGMGCAGGCQCGGKCKGMGQTATPGFFDQLTNPLGSDLTVLKQQIDTLNQQTAAVSSSITAGNWGTWALVGLSGVGLWLVVKGLRETARKVGAHTRARHARATKRAKLKAELSAL